MYKIIECEIEQQIHLLILPTNVEFRAMNLLSPHFSLYHQFQTQLNRFQTFPILPIWVDISWRTLSLSLIPDHKRYLYWPCCFGEVLHQDIRSEWSSSDPILAREIPPEILRLSHTFYQMNHHLIHRDSMLFFDQKLSLLGIDQKHPIAEVLRG